MIVEIARRSKNLAAIVHEQLPRVLREKVVVSIKSDSFQLRPLAKFAWAGHSHECHLENTLVDGVQVCCVVPAETLARLSVEVP